MSPEELPKKFDFSDVDSRIKRLIERQKKSNNALKRLMGLVDKIAGETYPLTEKILQLNNANIAGNNCIRASSSSPIAQSSSPPSTSKQSISRTTPPSAMRQNQAVSTEREMSSSSCQTSQQEPATEQYPQQVGDVVILGPNGTKVDERSYNSITWSSSASATRQLLGFVFTSDTLATHTLTGKPSPAFYGRERPAKMQLDPVKARDIIHCVRSKLNCSEREIRAAITTKCSDTSKKYKRRSQKQMDGNYTNCNQSRLTP